jgi:ketosteroid isomerase-like protein
MKAQDCLLQDVERLSVNRQWACYISTHNMDSLATLYTSNAIKVRATGEVFNIADAITRYYSKKEVGIEAIETNFRVNANAIYDYEMGNFTLANGDHYKHVIIWNTTLQKRDFEFISKAESNIPLDPNIEARRNQWIQLCNAHDALALVSELYATNTVYYNHKPVVVGVDAVAKEYGYMNNPQYTLSLTPLHLEMVTPTLAFEIGQCSGSYNGKYIIIWQKDAVGIWKVLVDSNI